MASEKGDSTWLHLTAKPSQEDIEEDEAAFAKNPDSHIPMTTRREIWLALSLTIIINDCFVFVCLLIHIRAWYAYDIARTPYYVILLGLVLPVYLSIITTRSGCINNTPYGCDYENKPIMASSNTLVVYIGNWSLKPEAWVTFTIAISGVLQVIGYLWMSSIADYSTFRSNLLRIATIIGGVMVFSALFIPDSSWFFFGIFAAFSLVPLGLSYIFYNSYLPVLVENHWLIRRLQRELRNELDANSSDAPNEISGDSYVERHKHLVRSIQDDVSQFAYCLGYIGCLFATILAGAALFMLEDVTTEIVDGYGTVNKDDANEYWMKPVVGVDVWWTTMEVTDLASSQVITTASYLHGIQLQYNHDGDLFDGLIYGVTNSDDFILDYDENAVSIQLNTIQDSHDLTDGEHITSLNLFEDPDRNIISGLEFITDSNTISIGDTTPTDSIEIKPGNYPNYELSGYQIAATTHSETENQYEISLPILSGYSFAFMDIEKGQYGSTLDNRLVYSMCGVWSLLFSIPAFLFLKQRKSDKSLPESNGSVLRKICPPICTVSFSDYWETIKSAKQYPHLFWCLIAWFIWSDAENTVATVGVLFGISLGMTSVGLLVLLLEIQILAFVGGMFFVWLQKRFQWTNKSLVMIHLAINSFLPLYGMIGLIPGSPFGVVSVWELYVFTGLCYAFHLGSVLSSSRSLYGHLIPEGKESQFFGLYEFTNKGSSWIGPLLATFISNAFSLRWVFAYVFVFFAVAVPILHFKVDYEQGMIDAGKVKDITESVDGVDKELDIEMTGRVNAHVGVNSSSQVDALQASLVPEASK